MSPWPMRGAGTATGEIAMSFTSTWAPAGIISILSTSANPAAVVLKIFTPGLVEVPPGGLPFPPTAVGLNAWVATSSPLRNPSIVTLVPQLHDWRFARPMLLRANCVILLLTSYVKLVGLVVVPTVWPYCHTPGPVNKTRKRSTRENITWVCSKTSEDELRARTRILDVDRVKGRMVKGRSGTT